jgi:hypothetical protein
MNRLTALLFLTIGLALAACGGGGGPTDAQNHDCASQATGGMRWAYYPGYGCGPVPRAQTNFS